jgi:hypothetical protein
MLSNFYQEKHDIHAILLLLAFLFLSGCASTPTYTHYELTSSPSGAHVYRGTSPDNLTFYKTTPFIVQSPTSLRWSNKYFQARKEGYKDSEVFQQPKFLVGTRTAIHFNLESKGGEAELAPYQERNTLAAYYDFLYDFPDSPIKRDVFDAMLVLIAESSDAEDQYERLANEYPNSVKQFPTDLKLAYTGPEGMRVKDVKALLAQGMGETVIAQKILTAGKPYADFNFDEIRALTEMGLTDPIIAAMLKVTNEQPARSSNGNTAPSAEQVQSKRPDLADLVLDNTRGRYMNPWTSDGVLADWVDKAINAKMGGATGSAVGAAAGAAVANQALDNVPGGALLGGFLGSTAGEAAGREAAIDEAYIRKTSDQSFHTLDHMARYLEATYSDTRHYADAVKAANEIYPGLLKAIRNQ